MKRGEVWWVNFDPSVGGEIRKQRPAVTFSEGQDRKSSLTPFSPIAATSVRLRDLVQHVLSLSSLLPR